MFKILFWIGFIFFVGIVLLIFAIIRYFKVCRSFIQEEVIGEYLEGEKGLK